LVLGLRYLPKLTCFISEFIEMSDRPSFNVSSGWMGVSDFAEGMFFLIWYCSLLSVNSMKLNNWPCPVEGFEVLLLA
jgi:hypothetical protein